MATPYHVSKRGADADLGQEIPTVAEETRGRNGHATAKARHVVAAPNLRFLRLGVDRDAEASRKCEPAAIDRLRPKHEAEPRCRQIDVVVVSVEGKPFVTD